MQYLWNNGATTNAITTPVPGTYTVTAVDNAGCRIEASAIFYEHRELRYWPNDRLSTQGVQ